MKIHYHSDHLGSASFVTDREGAVCQHIQYLPFGELFVSQRNCELDSRYKFTAKELDNETSYTYFGARYYDSDLSVWLSVDPMSDERSWVSPYAYCQNNPIILVDPRGMLDDWYRDDETGATFWHEGSESYIERDGVRYRNIGATHSIRRGNVIENYTQNEITSMTYIGAEKSSWETQIGNSESNCYNTSCQMLNNEGVQTAGRSNEVLVTGLGENGTAGNPTSNAKYGFNIIDNELEHGNPIIVGVDYQDGSPNYDKMTDHFIVISSKTETFDHGKVMSKTYNYFDPRTSDPDLGTSPTNKLTIQNNKMVGTYNYYKGNQILNYTVTTVRTNL